MKYDVCILSRDRLYSQWILLLLSQKDYTVCVSDNHLTAPSASLYVADLDSIGMPKKENARVVCFSCDKDVVSRHGGILRPFSPDELFHLLDGARADTGDEQEIEEENGERIIRFDGRYIHLTQREYELYSMLFQANGQSVERAQICRAIWGCDETESLNIYIHYLRTKLEVNGVKVIKSHRGKGYSLIVRGDESALHN